MNALCPRCGAKLAIHEAGELVQCYSCQHEFAAEPVPPAEGFPWLKALRFVLAGLAALAVLGVLGLVAANWESVTQAVGATGGLLAGLALLALVVLLLATAILWIFLPLVIYSRLTDILAELRRLNR
jgi:DNA-directed RNA polymerase subunit RPC12/RpoP